MLFILVNYRLKGKLSWFLEPSRPKDAEEEEVREKRAPHLRKVQSLGLVRLLNVTMFDCVCHDPIFEASKNRIVTKRRN